MLSSRSPKGQIDPRNKALHKENDAFTIKSTGFGVRLLKLCACNSRQNACFL